MAVIDYLGGLVNYDAAEVGWREQATSETPSKSQVHSTSLSSVGRCRSAL